jgi:ribonuclease D
MTAPDALERFCAAVAAGTGPVALDAERASGFRYSQRAYLIQVRRRGAGTALIDPIALPDLSALNNAIGDAEWILHAATQDLACLAEVGLRPRALFDTELAGRLLGRERVSLAALVASELGWGLEKGHGATDWSVRPLSQAQLRYAALDVELLVELREALAMDLGRQRKDVIAQQEFASLLEFAPRDRGEEAWRRLSGIHRLRKPRNLAIARELWLERDRIAQQRDIAVGRLLPDSSIVAAAASAPTSLDALLAMKDFHGRGADRYRSQWWAAVTRAGAMDAADWPVAAPPPLGPPAPRTWVDRNPVAFAALEAARAGLSVCAERLSMPVENLISPDTVRRLCWEPPQPADAAHVRAFLESSGARPWQIEATYALLVDALATEPSD